MDDDETIDATPTDSKRRATWIGGSIGGGTVLAIALTIGIRHLEAPGHPPMVERVAALKEDARRVERKVDQVDAKVDQVLLRLPK